MTQQLKDILNLSIPERILIAEAVWSSIANAADATDSFELSNSQIKFLEEEIADYKVNPQVGSSWSDVKKRIGKNPALFSKLSKEK